jgi:hypothetical protein
VDPDAPAPADPGDELLACDACGEPIEGEPAGRGLLVFLRGDDVAREEPPLCEKCALAIGVTALSRIEMEEEDG